MYIIFECQHPEAGKTEIGLEISECGNVDFSAMGEVVVTINQSQIEDFIGALRLIADAAKRYQEHEVEAISKFLNP